MAYTKTVWVDDSAPAINATNLNNIEDGIETLEAQSVGGWINKALRRFDKYFYYEWIFFKF